MNAKQRQARKLAQHAGLHYSSDDEPGIHRKRHGRGFTYEYENGKRVGDTRQLDRIEQLAIPPAWTDVWINRDPRGHLQATGRDDQDRKQSLYHARWSEASALQKFHRLEEFGRVLPKIRRAVARDLRRTGKRISVLALLVRLLDLTGMRIGNEEYLNANGSRGLTTLSHQHLKYVNGSAEFRFTGKSKQQRHVIVEDRRAVAAIKRMINEDADYLFCFEGDDGPQEVTAEEVNEYLAEISSRDITAKDFRTWNACSQLMAELYAARDAEAESARKKQLNAAIKHVAEQLGNTPAVCKKSYLDQRLLEAYTAGEFPQIFANFREGKRKWLSREDQLLRRALARV